MVWSLNIDIFMIQCRLPYFLTSIFYVLCWPSGCMGGVFLPFTLCRSETSRRSSSHGFSCKCIMSLFLCIFGSVRLTLHVAMEMCGKKLEKMSQLPSKEKLLAPIALLMSSNFLASVSLILGYIMSYNFNLR